MEKSLSWYATGYENSYTCLIFLKSRTVKKTARLFLLSAGDGYLCRFGLMEEYMEREWIYCRVACPDMDMLEIQKRSLMDYA